MKRILLTAIFLCVVWPVFSQRLFSVIILPFEAPERGVSALEAASLRKQVIDEVLSWESIIVLDDGETASADFYVQGKIVIETNVVALAGTTFDAKTDRPLTSYREQAANINALSERVFSFCSQMAKPIPLPNLLLGKWISTIEKGDGPLTCLLEFKPNRIITVERYDTYEHRQGNGLTYQGIGSGTYSFGPQIRRTITIRDTRGTLRDSPVDGAVSINLQLEDILPKYEALTTNRISLIFSNNNNHFELLTGGFPCGENFDGASVYPDRTIIYTQFTKIQ
jgi:hypothetical protein